MKLNITEENIKNEARDKRKENTQRGEEIEKVQ